MSRIRTVKPSFWTSQTLARVSHAARLVFIGLWNEADDEGRLADAPKRLAGALFPFDDDVDAGWLNERLDELVKVGAIVRYGVDGGRFIAVPGFETHQSINKPRPSALPPPPGAVPEDSGSVPVPAREGDHTTPVRNGMEWNGMEEEGKEPAPARTPPEEPKVRPQLVGRTPRGNTLFGKIEADSCPATPKAALDDAHYGPLLCSKFPALDGQGSRPTLIGEVTADFASFQRKWRAEGRDAAFNGLISWLARRYGPHDLNFKRNGGVDVDAIVNGRR